MGFEIKKKKVPRLLSKKLLRLFHKIKGCPIKGCSLNVEYKYQSVKVRFFSVHCKCDNTFLYFEDEE